MDINISPEVIEFLKKPNYSVLGTLRKDGSIQMSIIWYEFEEGVLKFSTTTDRIKYKNIQRDPRVTILIYDSSNPYHYIEIEGNCSGIAKEGGHDFIDHLSEKYTGNKTYQGDPNRTQDRVTITITPNRFRSFGS